MISTLRPGIQFLRSVIARAASPGADGVELARSRYGDRAASLTKAAVAAGSINSGGWGAILSTPEAAEFFTAVKQASLIGKLGLREVPLNVRLISVATGFSAFWVSAGAPKPLSKAAIAGSSLPPRKVAGLFVGTQELFRHSSPLAEQLLRDDLVRVIAEELDRAFIDPTSAAIVEERPASITNAVTAIPSSGSPNVDIAALLEDFEGDLLSASFISDPVTASQIALSRDSTGAFLFPDVGVRGGVLLGLPFVVTRASPRTTSGGVLALVDGSGIAIGSEGVRVATSGEAALAMRDDPSAPSEMVSVWQCDAVAILAEVAANWEIQRPGSVSVVTDALYPTAVS